MRLTASCLAGALAEAVLACGAGLLQVHARRDVQANMSVVMPANKKLGQARLCALPASGAQLGGPMPGKHAVLGQDRLELAPPSL